MAGHRAWVSGSAAYLLGDGPEPGASGRGPEWAGTDAGPLIRRAWSWMAGEAQDCFWAADEQVGPQHS